MINGDGGFWIIEKGRKIAFYQKENATPNQAPARNNYLHPVYLPDGTEITEDAPADHPHHRGIFWAWHQVIIDGKPVGDPWKLDEFCQDVQNIEFTKLSNGNGEFRTNVFWNSSRYCDGKKPYLQEQSKIIFHKLKNRLQIITFEIQLQALVDHLKLGGADNVKGYGGFSLRLKLPCDIAFSGESGEIAPKNEAVESSQYINISGSLSKKAQHGGVLIYADPNNQSCSQTWVLRRKNSMQNAVFPGRVPVGISAGKPLILKYALALYNGNIKERKLVKRMDSLL
jgi:hypothetical protein